MKYSQLSIPAAVLLILTINACSTQFLDSETTTISINHNKTDQKLTDIISLEGYTALESNASIELEGIRKILFKDDKVVVLNYVGDIQELWVFDQHTGKSLLKIGTQNHEPDGYDGLNDIAFDGNDIRCSVAGKMSFMNYDLGGNLRSSISSGVFGEELEQHENGGFVVYNEYNSTKVSGLNHLVFYDRSGNITKRTYPYLATQDGNGYQFAGSLTASGGLWFNPPFCDTLFEIKGEKVIPRYHFDFGQRAMPESIRQKKLTGWDTHKYSFLNEGLAKIGRFFVFEYSDEQKIKLGIFDEVSNQFASLRDLGHDYLYELVQLGNIFPKDDKTFALVLSPARIKYLVNKGLLDMVELDKRFPALSNTLKTIDNSSNPVILYLGFSPGAGLEEMPPKSGPMR
jgi:6-bladed beta-propeller